MTAELIDVDAESDILIRTVVSRVWRKYRGYVEFDDLHQEALLWWYTTGQKHLPVYLADQNKGRISISVWRVAEQYAANQKAQQVGYRPQDQYRYSAREVHELLPIALDPEGLPDNGHGDAPKGNLAESGEVLAALIDVRRALHFVSEEDMHFLTLVDDCSYDWERVAARMTGGVPDSLRRRHARIAERMARWLSSNHEEDYR